MDSSRFISFKNLMWTMVLLFVTHSAQAHFFGEGHYAVVGGEPGLSISGGTPNSCIPEGVTITRSGSVITATLVEPDGILLCFSAFRGWQVSGVLPSMPEGLYQVNVVQSTLTQVPGTEVIGTFNISLPNVRGVQSVSVPTMSASGLGWLALSLLMLAWVANRRRLTR